ncbi:DEAD/DEAH box helicase [Micromonospora sp. PPF5-17]|uniref:DEAD/DEAH box helicase n=1 Tax=Micromonospora solifontis TaxID=2487138 RepID=A0ABX9WNK8_9ACTN|nr:DEAD/DEAH box helicase [Micromonospora sp. PPF5-17B]NES34615.1 DEAD/DEAH box helicase [Micromonospora solifontis]NES57021.1 DEAD/DEAH box helicase [Micromonospora sp. PPF5-6]RNM01964.1 DEAD/DEAH box helicase [Micromonospora solifontis]
MLRRLRLRHATDPVTHVERVPARAGEPAPWPEWAPAELRAALARRGVVAPWRHQAEAAELAYAGEHVVVATGTASGKSLAYQLPALATLLADPRATVLYLAPTKALAADQLRAVAGLELDGVRPATYDGDTPRAEREWIRRHSRFVLTNPDMLHHGILPGHAHWSGFLRRLAYVVIDECHTYRGVFGSHVAHVLRRLRRQCARYGRPPGQALAGSRSTPTFVLASATSGDPATAAGRLTGLPVTAVTEDTSPRGGVTFALWKPPLLPPPSADEELADLVSVRRSALRETADLLTDSVVEGVRTLAFVRSRRGAEVVAANARRALDEAVPGLGDRVAAYRAGYLREERRELERALLHGDLLGLASTNALELGVDLVGLDAVLICGWPGTRASLWQQAGRAGRSGDEALAVLVARDDPLDTYLVHHPEALFGRPVEATVLDPANPYVLAPQLACAAHEAPLTPADLELFGEGAKEAVDSLVEAGALRQRPTGWYWRHRERPEVDLRGEDGAPVCVVEESTGRLLGTVDGGSSHFLLHPGAVYLHQGVSYVVDSLDLADGCALVHAEEPDWSTHARDVTSLSVVSVRSYVDAGPVGLFLGEVDVTSQVVSYQRRRIATGEVIDTRPLDLPARELRTVAVWFTVSPGSLAAAGIEAADIPGALHAAEHAGIGLLPLMATCDRWDIGGLSTALHPDTEAPTVFVYDGHPGGAGFAERAYRTASAWLRATRDAIAECGCETGCPSCVQSPKCGNGNNPLAKPDAVKVLDVVLANLPDPAAPASATGGAAGGTAAAPHGAPPSGPAGLVADGSARAPLPRQDERLSGRPAPDGVVAD